MMITVYNVWIISLQYIVFQFKVVLRKLVIKKQRHEKVINLKNWFQLAMQSLYCERLKKRRGRKYVTPLEACGEWWQSMTAPMMCHGGMNLKEVSHATVDRYFKMAFSSHNESYSLPLTSRNWWSSQWSSSLGCKRDFKWILQ